MLRACVFYITSGVAKMLQSKVAYLLVNLGVLARENRGVLPVVGLGCLKTWVGGVSMYM